MEKKINYNRWNKKNLYPSYKAEDVLDSVNTENDWQTLMSAKQLWDNLHDFRIKRRREGKFTFGDQWNDMIPDPDRKDKFITEEEAIRRQGKMPLKYNLIRQLTNSVVGQFRQSQTEPIVILSETDDVNITETDEKKIAELYTESLKYVYEINQLNELDSEALIEYMVSASTFQKLKYDMIPSKFFVDGHIENKNPARMYWSETEDLRNWDIERIGEIHDIPISEVVRLFAKSEEQAIAIREMYIHVRQSIASLSKMNMTTRKIDNLDFLYPYDSNLCRVIEDWKIESKKSISCHDTLTAEIYYVDDTPGERAKIKAENSARIADAVANGMNPEDVLTIETRWELRKYWYYRFFTPQGNILMQGETPYEHKMHPYIISFYSKFDGKPHSFVENVIDPQKLLNRNVTLNDFVVSSGAKEPVVVNTNALDGMDYEGFVAEYPKVGATIPVKLKPGESVRDVVATIESGRQNLGTYDIINLMMTFINDISGVQGAMQGKQPSAGTPAALYQSEIQQSSVNLIDILTSFNNFRMQRDNIILKLIQQYYTPDKYIRIAGKKFAKEAKYASEKGTEADVQSKLIPSTNSATYKTFQDQILMTLLQGNFIDLKILLNNSPSLASMKDSLLQEIEEKEAQMQQGQIPQGISPEIMAQIQQGQMSVVN